MPSSPIPFADYLRHMRIRDNRTHEERALTQGEINRCTVHAQQAPTPVLRAQQVCVRPTTMYACARLWIEMYAGTPVKEPHAE